MFKKNYEEPSSELLIVHFEDDFLNGPSTGNSNIEIPEEEDDEA